MREGYSNPFRACTMRKAYSHTLDKRSCAPPRFHEQRVHGLSVRLLFERSLLGNDSTRHLYV